MHATFSSNWSTSKMFKQASLKPVEPFTIINNQWKSSQLSTGDHPCPRGPVGSTAVLSLRWENKKIRKQVAFWTATNFLGDKAMKYPLQGEMWKYMIIAKTLVSLKHIARDENVLTKFSSGHRIATASEKGTVIRWRIFVLCSSCTDHYIYPLMIFQIFGEEYKNHFHFIINTSNTNTNFQGFLLPWRCKAVRAASWPEKARYHDIIIALLHHVTIISMVHSNNHIILKKTGPPPYSPSPSHPVARSWHAVATRRLSMSSGFGLWWWWWW